MLHHLSKVVLLECPLGPVEHQMSRCSSHSKLCCCRHDQPNDSRGYENSAGAGSYPGKDYAHDGSKDSYVVKNDPAAVSKQLASL